MAYSFRKSTVLLTLAAATALAATAPGARSAAAVAEVIGRHTDEITAVYNTYLNAGLPVEGTVKVRFTIAPTGVVTASEVASSTTGVKLFDEAVAATVATWDFGPAAGDAVSIIYPFTFRRPVTP